MGAKQLMMGITTNIRQAVTNDMPHLLGLAEIEYNLFDQRTPFSADVTQHYIEMIMADPQSLGLVIEDRYRIPFGFLSGTISYIDLSTEPTAQIQHWFVHNPNHRYGHKHHGLELVRAFESWAHSKQCQRLSLSIRMNPQHRRSYDRTFARLGYTPNYVFYSKELV